MDKQQEKITMEHLSALYWLKVLDEFDGGEKLPTLTDKYQHFGNEPETDEEEEEMENLDIAVKELIEMGYVTGEVEHGYITRVEFAPTGAAIVRKIKNEDSLQKIMKQIDRESNFNKLKQGLYDNRELIAQVLIGIVSIVKP